MELAVPVAPQRVILNEFFGLLVFRFVNLEP